MDDHMTSPSVHKKQMKPNEQSPSETVFSAKQGDTPTSPPQKSKRATSFIKKKPRLERGLSDQSVLRLKSNVHLGKVAILDWQLDSHAVLSFTDVNSSTSPADVSILVTEPSPEVPVGPNITNPNQTLIHHVIVHRESEEYQTDFDNVDGTRKTKRSEVSNPLSRTND